MATRPELHIAVAKTKSKASEYNDNFDMMMDYCEATATEAKDYVDTTLEGNVFYRILGETIFSLIPLADAFVHLLDGSIISGSGIYADFVEHIVSLATNYPDCFCTESQWQASVAQYGVCGKFVNNGISVRLPKVTGIVEGTIDVTALGDLVEAGLPNITGEFRLSTNQGGFERTDETLSRAFYSNKTYSSSFQSASGSSGNIAFDASRSSSIYGNSSTVQPQTIKGYYYIVVATAIKTDIEVDIDEIASDLNGKAERDLSNCTKPYVTETYSSGASWYRVWSDYWCEQGGHITGSSNAFATVNLLKSYANTNYNIQATTYQSGSGNHDDFNSAVNSSNKSSSSFQIYRDDYADGIDWQACGYIV